MIPSNYAICYDPPGYPLCWSCNRNLDNHPVESQQAVQLRQRQQWVEPDDRISCRHWESAHHLEIGP